MLDFLISDPLGFFFNFLLVIFLLFVLSGLSVLLGYFVFIAFRFRNREKHAIESTLLEVAMPRDNEVKVDAAEQLFSAFTSLHKGGRFAVQPALSFEIVGFPGDIRFFVHTPTKYKDMVEKQINGAYPDAEITEVNEGTQEEKLEAFYTLEKHAVNLKKLRAEGINVAFEIPLRLKELISVYRGVELEQATGSCPIDNDSGNIFEREYKFLNEALFGEKGQCEHCKKKNVDKHYHCPSCKKKYANETSRSSADRTKKCGCGFEFAC